MTAAAGDRWADADDEEDDLGGLNGASVGEGDLFSRIIIYIIINE